MDILSDNIFNNPDSVAKITHFLQGATPIEEEYQYNESEKKCLFRLDRFLVEEPSKILFIKYLKKRTNCIIEIYPVIKFEKTKEHSYAPDDFIMHLNKQGNVLEIETHKQEFYLRITPGTKIRLFDINS